MRANIDLERTVEKYAYIARAQYYYCTLSSQVLKLHEDWVPL